MNRYLMFAGAFLAGILNAQAQSDSTLSRFAETINRTGLENHLEILASDSFMGRETGFPGQKMAADYLRSQFMELGLKPPVEDTSYYQPFTLTSREYTGVDLKVGKDDFKLFDDFYHFFSYTDTTVSLNSVVFTGYGMRTRGWNSYEGIDVAGKAVMLIDGEPRSKDGISLITGSEESSLYGKDRSKKIELARNAGAGLILVVREDYEDVVPRIKMYVAQTRMQLEENGKEVGSNAPVVYISPSTADIILGGKGKFGNIKRKLIKKERPVSRSYNKNVTLEVQREVNQLESENVLGLIEGSEKKDEVVVVTCHYDHIGKDGEVIYNGADDDGSGTSSILEIAEAFSIAVDSGYRPSRSILFIGFSGEEKGLLGSKYYSMNPVFPLESTVANLNIDMVGRTDKEHEGEPEYVYLIGSDRLSMDLHELSEKANADFTQLDLDYRYNSEDDPNQFYRRSDHYNFAKHNVPVIFYFRGVHEDYHQPGDIEEKIEYDSLTTIARLVFYTAWRIGNKEERLKLNAD